MRGSAPTLFVLLLLILTACGDERFVGSACEDGVCQPLEDDVDPMNRCLVTTLDLEVALDEDGDTSAELCLSQPLQRKLSGKVACEMYWDLSDTTARCADFPFAERVPDATNMIGNPAAEVCVIDQLPVHEPGDFDPSAAGGWYYDDFLTNALDACEGANPDYPRIAFGGSARGPQGTHVWLSCAQVWADTEQAAPTLGITADAVLVDDDFCAPVKAPDEGTPSDLGESCNISIVPEQGFEDQNVYVQAGASACSTGVCLAYHYSSPPAEGNPAEGEGFCSCRCDGAPGDEPSCDCGEGFTCAEVVSERAPESFAGSYCVREPMQ